MYSLVFLWCLVAVVTSESSQNKEAPTRDSIFSHIDSGDEIHNNFEEDHALNEEEIRSAFPVMNAFKSHSLFSPEDLKDKKEYDYADESSIDRAVQHALLKLHKRKKLFADAVKENVAEATAERHEVPTKKNVTAKELVDQVVRDEIKKHGKHAGIDEETNDSMNEAQEEPNSDSSSFEGKIHKKLAEISDLERRLTSLVTDVKHYLQKKKADNPNTENIGTLADNDDVDRILAFSGQNNKKRSEIPRNHVALITKFRNKPELVDKYIDDILDKKDDSSDTTANGAQRDLLSKTETETGLLRDAVPGEINSIPLSRLDKESDDYDNMATDRGIARDALVESPFSILDIKKTTGKKFRHNIT